MLADVVVISKQDLAPPASHKALTARLRDLNPRVQIATTSAPAVFSGQGAQPFRAETASEAAHSDGIGSFVLTWERPLAWPVVARTMDTLLAMRGSDILRAKGVLAIEGCAGPVVVQFVQHLAYPPVELQSWPDANRTSRLVFITRGIAERDIRLLFDAVERLQGQPRPQLLNRRNISCGRIYGRQPAKFHWAIGIGPEYLSGRGPDGWQFGCARPGAARPRKIDRATPTAQAQYRTPPIAISARNARPIATIPMRLRRRVSRGVSVRCGTKS